MGSPLAAISRWLSLRQSSGLRQFARTTRDQVNFQLRGRAHTAVRTFCDITCPPVIQRKPTTPSNRHTALTDKSKLYKGRPHPRLSVGLPKRAGRSRTTGRITVRHQGGGNKRLYRIIDFKRSAWEGIPGLVQRIEYDPNRSALIALVRHQKKCAAIKKKQRPDRFAYILCPIGLKIGQTVVASRHDPLDVKVGNAMTLRHVPVGTTVHNIELRPGYGGQMCRSAGTSARVLERDESKGLALLRLQSKEQRLVRLSCMVSIGQVSNPEHKNQSFGKAGRMRWKGIRPTVRGVAMNPVDHPHGGGEGKTSGGRPSVSKWGMPTKGYRTRNKRKKSSVYIVRQRHDSRR
ncbi:50S ribosomal protein L2 [Gracilariopsis chorda]|uniref:Large ribosomal subunit protein uL2m n=1 Tax=Gracilariopsis chorda TaxID=448386 RepID=A0A2V3IIF9_9FLOR|nr:50S ribosomal protein L2 [Gracilariopsis chorda]|eukprot:PXF41828.1 50S ribosomal protein L2 [Gracilariopsis chorda]